MKIKKGLIGILFILLAGSSVISCSQKEQHTYISDPEEFLNAIQRGVSEVYVDNLAFEQERTIILNYAIKVIGKNEKSTLSNVFFVPNGTNIPGEETAYSFSNIIFDGLIDKTNYDFATEGKTFESFFPVDKRCFAISVGYTNLTLDNCEFTRYAAYNGSAIYIDNPAIYRDHTRTLTINNCNFYNNISYAGTVLVGHDKGITSITNSQFYDNLVKECGGPGVANGKVNIDNVKVLDNKFYNFLNESRPDDLIHARGKEFAAVNQCGSMFFGASNGSITNCYIANNKTLYGGGLGINTPENKIEGAKMFFENIVINNNEAKYGGALYMKCGAGNTVKLINCSMFDNRATKGALCYITSLVPYLNDKMQGGVVDFVFCTAANNKTQEETSELAFYEVIMAKVAGKIEMHGSFFIDESAYTLAEDIPNYYANKVAAINDGVTTEDDLAKTSTNGLVPIKGSKADITVPCKTYKEWDESFKDETEARTIGFKKVEPPVDKSWMIVVSITVPCSIVLVGFIVTICLLRYRKRKEIGKRNIEEHIACFSYEQLLEVVNNNFDQYNLTNKEKEVIAHFLKCKKRKELAEALFISEDTAKTHISHIFKKMNISSKEDLKKIVNKYL